MARSPNAPGTIARAVAMTALAMLTTPGAAETQTIVKDGIEVSLSSPRERVRMVERFELTLSVTAPSRHTCAFPEVQDTLGPFRVLERTPIAPQTPEEGVRNWQRTYLLEPTEAGTGEIPPLTVTLKDATAPSETGCILLRTCDRSTREAAEFALEITTEPFAFTVDTLLPEGVDLTKPRALAGLASLVAERPTIAKEAKAGAVLLIILAALAAWWWRRKPSSDKTPAKPAHEMALAELNALERDANSTSTEQFFQSLSAIVRRYTLWRFDIVAPLRTTEELGQAMARSNELAHEERALLVRVLSRCDAVKFARSHANSEDIQHVMTSAREFIETTADASRLAATEAQGLNP